ncbi:hypothetical protein BDF14DRAFT_1803152 [Spinellus fusiger]|nr:hypothetical protein BDF14DRAFT_1803152 [Spinellus fusiger]
MKPVVQLSRLVLLQLGLLLFTCLSCVSALSKAQSGVVDWHQTWIGKTRWIAQLSPEYIVAATERNVLASINYLTGELSWRHLLDGPIDFASNTIQGVFTVTSKDTHIQYWHPVNGKLLWERYVGPTEKHPKQKAMTWGDGDVGIVYNNKFSKISPTGTDVWTWSLPEDVGLFHDVQKLSDDIFVISYDQTSTLYVFSIDSHTGKTLKKSQFPCHVKAEEIETFGNLLVWREKDILKWNKIGTSIVNTVDIKELISTLPLFKSVSSDAVQMIPYNVQAGLEVFVFKANILVNGATKTVAATFTVDPKGNGLKLVKELDVHESLVTIDMFNFYSTPFLKNNATTYTLEFISSVPSFESEQRTLEHNSDLLGDIVFAVTLRFRPASVFVVTASGSTLYYTDGKVQWSREEAIGHTVASEFIDLPEKKLWTQMADELSEGVEEQATITPWARYVRRLAVHSAELSQWPTWASERFAEFTASSAIDTLNTLNVFNVSKVMHLLNLSVPTTVVPESEPEVIEDPAEALAAQACFLNTTHSADNLYRDAFGFRKLLVSVTDTGKVIAQDTAAKGAIVWSRYFENVVFDQVFVVRTSAVKLPSLIVAIGHEDDGGYLVQHLYRLNALTGEDYISHIPEATEFFEPRIMTEIQIDKVMRLPIEDPEEKTRILVLYEAGTSRVYIYPDTAGSREAFKQFSPTFYFTHRNKQGVFRGYQVTEGYRGSLTASPVWSLELPESETVVALSSTQPDEKVASLGRVLGNRNVLYKYLNPHVFAVLSANKDRQTLKVRLVDAVKGAILHQTEHENVDTVHNDVRVIQSENWFVYHYWSNGPTTKGYVAAIMELFEGKDENERVKSKTFSSYDDIKPRVISSAFAFPYAVRTMGVTNTRIGVSTREVLFAISSNQILGITRRILDGRRPVDKPSKDDIEEGLIPYTAIPDERRVFLTHKREVSGIQHIIASPALLESTSLVFAYGLDTFYSRSSPSRQFDVLSEDFSKSQLLLTIAGLIIALLVTAPMVRRKRLNTLWK